MQDYNSAFGFVAGKKVVVYQGLNPRRYIWESESTAENARKARWLTEQLNSRSLSIQAINASHVTRQGKRRAIRRLAREILTEWMGE